MTDPLQIHHEQQKSYHELQTEFRAEALKCLRARLRKTAVVRGADGQIIAEFSMLDEKHKMEAMYDHPQDFDLSQVPKSMAQGLFSKANECQIFESMALPPGEGIDHDGPPLLQPIEHYTDIELMAYVDLALEKSKENK